MNGYSFRGNNCSFHFCLPFINEGQIFKEEFAPLGANYFIKELIPL